MPDCLFDGAVIPQKSDEIIEYRPRIELIYKQEKRSEKKRYGVKPV